MEFKKPLKEKTSMCMGFEHLCFFATKKSQKQIKETALRCWIGKLKLGIGTFFVGRK